MLILTREIDQQIVIGEYEVVVTVIDIRGDKVRLGFHGEKEIPIHRLEVKQAIDKEALGRDAMQDAEQGGSGLE